MTLEIFIHDVGHGQAVHAFTPNGQSIVIDLGCSEHFSPLEWLRRQTDTIDLLVITHPHGDHIDEILLLKKLGRQVRQLYVPRSLTREAVYQSNQLHYRDKVGVYLEYADRWTAPIAVEERVGDPAVSGGAMVNVFHGVGTAPSNINNHSLVVAFEYANSKIVIP